MSRGDIVSSLQISFDGVDPGSEAHMTMLRRCINQMFPAIARASSDEAREMHEAKASMFFERASLASDHDGDGMPVFQSFQWLSESELHRMMKLGGYMGEMPKIQQGADGQNQAG